MKTSTLAWIGAAIIVLGGGWYLMYPPGASTTSTYGNNPGTPGASTSAGVQGSPNQTNTGQSAVTPVVTVVHDATLGDYLVASNKMTLYRYTKDAAGISNCSGTCAANWPPYLHTTAETLVAGPGATGTLVTITRAEGTAQVTYKGVPLYFWKGDKKAGDTTGQGVGGVWYVMQP